MDKKPSVAVEANEYTKAASQMKATREGLVEQNPPKKSNQTETTVFPDLYPRNKIRPMSDDEITEKTEALLKAMTFSEKCQLLHSSHEAPKATGFSSYVVGVPRLGVPVMAQHDGPAGCNSIYETSNMPVELLAGCTFSPEMAEKYGKVIGEELVSIGSNWQLGCQFDLSRHPFWMRSRDTYGEDYYLTGEMAVAETRGVQSSGAGAMAKHMGAYCTNGDSALSSFVDEQTLHTAYLYPFEQACKRSKLASIMTTYTKLNGYFTASNVYMQKDVARDMWGWKGNMTTDAGGNQEFSTHLGTDNEMGAGHNDESNARAYLEAGLITMDDIDNALRHIFWGYGVAGYLGLVEVDTLTGKAKYQPGRTDYITMPDTYYHDRVSGLYDRHNEMCEEIAEKGYVLLKNDGALPLDNKALKNGVALIGYGAKHNIEGTGFERSFGVLEYMRSPGDALRELCGDDINVTTEVMFDKHGYAIPAEFLYQDEKGEKQGLVRTYGITKKDCYVAKGFGMPGMPPMGGDDDGEEMEMMPPPGMGPAKAEKVDMPPYKTGSFAAIDSNIEFLTNCRQFTNGFGGTAMPNGSVYTWKGFIKAPESGEYTIALHSIGGKANLRVLDGENELVAADCSGMGFGHGPQWEFDEPTPEGMTSARAQASLEKGKLYQVIVTAQATYDEKDLSLRLAWITPSQKAADHANAIKAAKENPVVIYFAREGVLGHGGFNFTKFDLEVNELNDLLEVQKAAKEAGNKFVVIVYSRSAFALDGDWEPKTDGIIAAFYPGQAGNTALAKLLCGKANFSGKLCMTIPKKTEDTCVSVDEATSNERRGKMIDMRTPFTATFTEKLDFGYRWNEREGVRPGFAFGHGLSYTTFEYSDFAVKAAGEGLVASFNLKNTGAVEGSEVAQIYIGEGQAPEYVFFAKKQLCGFTRVENLQPGEKRAVTIDIPARMLCYWDINAKVGPCPDGSVGKWVKAKGKRQIMLAAASDDIKATVEVEVK